MSASRTSGGPWARLVVIALMLSVLAAGIYTPRAGAQTAPPWDGNFHPYRVGDLVTYNGSTYQCIQAHTSQPDWTPAAVPALWKLVTPGPSATPTRTSVTATPTRTSVTATPTRTGPTATPSRTATARPTPTPLPPGSTNLNAAPYLMPRDNNPPDVNTVMAATGIRQFMLAFILANGSSCSPAWDGVDPIASDTVVQGVINKVRAAGGDIAVSIGGFGGTKLGQVCGTPSATANAYDQVVNKYNLKAIDFDIEEPEIENGAAVANELGAAQMLQSRHPGINISITLPTTTQGLNFFGGCNPNNPDAVLSKAKTLGFTPTTWNIMPFDGGFGPNMGTSTINVAEVFHGQLKTCFGWNDATAYSHSGLSLMNGRSDTGEFTFVADFNAIKNYEKSHGMTRMTFWSINRDRQCNPPDNNGTTSGICSSVPQTDWDFTRVLVGF